MEHQVTSASALILASRIECIKGILFGCKGRTDEMSQLDANRYIEQLVKQSALFIADNNMEPIGDDELSEAAKHASSQASWQESASILNPGYNLSKNDVLREQANALRSLDSFIKSLKRIQELKDKVTSEDAKMAKVRGLFM